MAIKGSERATEEAGSRALGGAKHTFRALGHRNYRLFFSGNIVSLVGTWMQNMAMSWLVYRLTGSTALLGLVSFTSMVPAFFLSPFAGAFVDRWPKRKVVVGTQTLAMLQAFTLAALELTGVVQVWHIVALSMVLGLVNAFDMPGRQAFMIEIVEKREDLPNAIALNSSIFNVARLIGPMLAGIAIYRFGEGFCFLMNGVSFLAVIAGLLAMRVPKARRPESRNHVLQDLKEGASYVWEHRAIRLLILFIAVTSFVNGAYTVLLPVYAKHIIGGGERMLGYLYGAIGFGAFAGAISLASRKSVHGLSNTLAGAAFVLGGSLAVFGQAKVELIALPLLVAIGFGQITHMASTNTLVQTLAEDKMRGRVMSFYAMAFYAMPIGSLLCGWFAEAVGGLLRPAAAHGATPAAAYGSPIACVAMGTTVLVAALLFARSRRGLGPLMRGDPPAPVEQENEPIL